ncbi:hypothetical protein ACHAP5_011574 [Fusarium lateritium]
MTTYLHVLMRRKRGVRWYNGRIRDFIREYPDKYTCQLYRGNAIFRVSVECHPEEKDGALFNMAHALAPHGLLNRWQRVLDVVNESPTEVPDEALDEALDLVAPEP